MSIVKYSNSFRKELCIKVCEERKSTSQTAKSMGIPLKTAEKWITIYNKDPHAFDAPDNDVFEKRKIHSRRYDEMGKATLIKELKRRDSEIDYLKSIIKGESERLKSIIKF